MRELPRQAEFPRKGLERLCGVSGKERFDVNVSKLFFLIWGKKNRRKALNMNIYQKKNILGKICDLNEVCH